MMSPLNSCGSVARRSRYCVAVIERSRITRSTSRLSSVIALRSAYCSTGKPSTKMSRLCASGVMFQLRGGDAEPRATSVMRRRSLFMDASSERLTDECDGDGDEERRDRERRHDAPRLASPAKIVDRCVNELGHVILLSVEVVGGQWPVIKEVSR